MRGNQPLGPRPNKLCPYLGLHAKFHGNAAYVLEGVQHFPLASDLFADHEGFGCQAANHRMRSISIVCAVPGWWYGARVRTRS